MTVDLDASAITVLQTLELLDGEYKGFADGIADGRYAFWLGSGISRSRFPMLGDLVVDVLEFLRGRLTTGNSDCVYLRALERAFQIALLSPAEKQQIDYSVCASSWPIIGQLKDRLAN